MPRAKHDKDTTTSGFVWLLLLLTTLPAFWVLPAIDDWGTTVPIFDPRWADFRPGLKWRPFEQLLLVVVGLRPSIHGWFLHGVTILGHWGSAWAVGALARRFGASTQVARWAIVIFLLAPGVTAAAWSLDSAVQTWSTALGMLGALSLTHGPSRRNIALWLTLAAAASMWKESGLAWFVVGPLVAALYDSQNNLDRRSWARLRTSLAWGGSALAVYFSLRFMLAGEVQMGASEGRYSMGGNPMVWAKNAMVLFGAAFSTVDTIALFSNQRSWLIVVASGVAGLPLLWLTVRTILNRHRPREVLLILASLLGLAAPHLVIQQASEMYAHPLVALGVSIGVVVASPSGLSRRWGLLVAILLFLLAGAGVGAHKLSEMIASGEKAAEVAQRIDRCYPKVDDRPDVVCSVVNEENASNDGYSVFQANAAIASQWGRSVTGLWGWRSPKIFFVPLRTECPQVATETWVISPSGDFSVLPGKAAPLGTDGAGGVDGN